MKYIGIAAVVLVVALVVLVRIRRALPVAASVGKKEPYNGPKPVLRQFGDLRPQDFEEYPVWIQCHVVDYDEPWYAETDEETFRPRSGGLPAEPGEGILLVKAKLTLADGTVRGGFLTPQHTSEKDGKSDLGIIQPQLFLESGERLSFWGGVMGADENQIQEVYAQLGRRADQVFPIHFKAEAGLTGGVASGTIRGFYSIARGGRIDIRK
jgi:hypothetical protein